MFFRSFFFLSMTICCCTAFSYAQEDRDTQQINLSIFENLLESITTDEESELDLSEIEELLNYYLRNPIDLNTASYEDLKNLIFLSDLQIQEILDHRNESGNFVSIYELQSISSLDEISRQWLLPFIRISTEKKRLRSNSAKKEHDLMLRYGRVIETQRGYSIKDEDRSRYLGTPDHLLLRYRFRINNKFQLAVNMEKDPGEEFFTGTQSRGFDYYSGSILIQDVGSLKKLVIGDYSLAFGQGLNIWNSYSFGKGALVHHVARNGTGIRPHTSTNEADYLRGLATTLQFGKIELSPFVSYRSLDGTLTSDSSAFSSLNLSGYHRTPAEIKNRESVDQFIYGANMKYSSSHLNIGGTFLSTNFNKPRSPNEQLYNQFSFRGRSLESASIYYQYTYKNLYLFGEGAANSYRSFGFLNGAIASLSDQLSFVALYRNYQKDFYGFLSSPFSENTNATNENGFYSGLIWNPNRRVEWVAYADYFRFPWIKYRVDAPSDGYDLFTQISYAPIRSNIFSIRYRYRNKQENLSSTNVVNEIANVVRHQIRLQGSYKVNDNISFRNRAELITYKKGNSGTESGWLFYHDLIYKPMGNPVSGNVRLAAFKTDSYNSRHYVFENNVLYAHSSIPYYGEGLRFYINLRYRLSRKINFWARYASSLYKDEGIGSGLNYIEGRTRSDIRLQLRFQI